MARYIDADKLCEALKSMASVQYPDKQNTILGVVSSVENFPTADVVPRRKFAKGLLLDLKAAVTNKATYPDFNADYAYVNLKVFNALVQDLVKKYEEGEDES